MASKKKSYIKKNLRTVKKSKRRSPKRSIQKSKRRSPRRSIQKKPRYSKKICPKGSISRKSFKKKSGSRLKATCVKSKNLRAKAMSPLVYLPTLKTGSLSKYGYSVLNTPRSRHIALKKAASTYGTNKLVKKLNAVRVLTRNTSPKNYIRYTDDIYYVQNL